jgi:hypothetical protein
MVPRRPARESQVQALMSIETCSVCHHSVECLDGKVIYHHSTTPPLACRGSDRTSVEQRRRNRDKRYLAVYRAATERRDEAAIVLDAVLEHRPILESQRDELVELAVRVYRARHSGRAVTFYILRRPPSWRALGDAYCQFCGASLWQTSPGTKSRRSSRAIRDERQPQDFTDGILKRFAEHTTPCALMCLAGMREMIAKADHRPHLAQPL